jgi:predicted nucleic acid-binding protein
LATFFLDTSALAKRYHTEKGSDQVDRILDQPSGQSMVSRLSLVEFESVLAIKARRGEIGPSALDTVRRRFKADIARKRLLVAAPIADSQFLHARRLVIEYGISEGLRTLDALQLAVALDLRRLNRMDVFVSADHRLCRVASLCGCTALNSESSGTATPE